MEAPNLDAMNWDELQEASNVFRLLAEYATHKARAMYLRQRGFIVGAMSHEKKCDELYGRLPTGVGW